MANEFFFFAGLLALVMLVFILMSYFYKYVYYSAESLKQRTSHFVHCESAAKFCHGKAAVKQRCGPLLKSCNET